MKAHVQDRDFCILLHISEGKVAFFSAKRWDRRNRVDLIESATPCHDAQVVGSYRVSVVLNTICGLNKSQRCEDGSICN